LGVVKRVDNVDWLQVGWWQKPWPKQRDGWGERVG